MNRSPDTPSQARWRWPRIVAGALVLAAGAAGAAWVWRAPLAEFALGQWCQQQALDCRGEIAHLDVSSAAIEMLSVRSAAGEPVSAQQVEIDYRWSWPMRIEITRVSADAPVVRARFDGERFDLYGLEKLITPGDGAGATPLPALAVSDGRLELETPAGTLAGAVALQLDRRGHGRAEVDIAPVRLSEDGDHLALDGGWLRLTRTGERLEGVIELDLASADLGTARAGRTRLNAAFVPAPETGPMRASFELDSAGIAYGAHTVSGLTAAGDLRVAMTEQTPLGAALSAVRQATVEIAAQDLRSGAVSAAGVAVDLDLAAEPGRALSGPVAVALEGAQHGDWGAVRDSRAVGDIDIAADGAIAYRGGLTLRGAALTPTRRVALAERLALPSVLAAHEAALARALDAGLADFDLGLELSAARDPGEGEAPASWRATARRAAQLEAASGLSLAIRPFTEAPWLELAGAGQALLRGQVAVTGPGAPPLQVQLDEARITGDGLTLSLGPSTLQPWRAGGLVVSADLDRLEWRSGADGAALSAGGRLGATGTAGAARLEALSLFGGIQARRDAAGWRAQTAGSDCLGLTADGLGLAALDFGALALSLCPPGGRLLQPSPGGGSAGSLVAGDIDLPVSTGRSSGTLALRDTRLDWRLGDGIAAVFDGAALDLGLTIGDRALDISGTAPRLSFEATATGPPSLVGSLSQIGFAGTLIPAEVTAGAATFDLASPQTGLAGTARLSRVRIADFRADPLYSPLVAEFDASLEAGELSLQGPVHLEASGQRVGDAELALSLPEIDGALTLVSEPLRFQPGGLQPHDISDRLRGVFTDARGTLDGQAHIRIEAGRLSGTGAVEVSEFGFQTLALGRVSGVNGAVRFDDLLALQTPPGQRVTIGRIDPGLPLEDGEVSFQLDGPGLARLESALWPFAGGVLAVEPTRWQVGADRRTLAVRADAIELAELTALLDLPDFEATGTVSGRFPIEFVAGNAYIRDARLAADRSGGRLSYTGQVGQQAGSGNENVAMAFRALRDFKFTVLEIGADGNLAGEIIVTARVEGRNPDVLEGQAFNFNISIESQLGQLIASTQRLRGTDWLTEITAQTAGQ